MNQDFDQLAAVIASGLSKPAQSVADPDCSSCGQGEPRGECPNSERPCGHHSNYSWSHDECCWCGKAFGEQIDDFDARIELRILAAKLRLRVHVEILANRAQRDLQIETHYALRDLFLSIKHGVHHAEF